VLLYYQISAVRSKR